jgi:hypothetical protein
LLFIFEEIREFAHYNHFTTQNTILRKQVPCQIPVNSQIEAADSNIEPDYFSLEFSPH